MWKIVPECKLIPARLDKTRDFIGWGVSRRAAFAKTPYCENYPDPGSNILTR